MLQAHLKVIGGKNDGKLISLAVRKFLVGREQDCHLRPNSDLVSRHHCVFHNDGYSIRLRDLGSTNGTFVNDERLRGETTLQPGDRVRIGRLDLEILISEPVETASAASVAPANEQPAAPEAANGDTAVLSSGDTMYELPTVPAEAAEIPAEAADEDTAILSRQEAAALQQQQQQGWYPPQQAGYPYPQGYPQPEYAGYPPPYGMPGYPPPGYPQWGQPNPYMGYPPPYPPQSYPPQQAGGYPPQGRAPQEASQEQEAANKGSSVPIPPVRLPDPETTGANQPPAAAPAAGQQSPAQKPASPADMPSNTAADIIKQYRQRR